MSLGIMIFKFVLERKYNEEIKGHKYEADLSDTHKWHNRVADMYWENDSDAFMFRKYNPQFFSQQKIFYRLWDYRI